MNITVALREIRRLYIDAAPIIYFVEENPTFVAKMQLVFSLIEATWLDTVSSVLTLTEVLVQPLKMGNTDLAQDYHDILADSYAFASAPITAEIAISAGAIRARYSLPTPDAVHVATAMHTDCDTILTNDSDFRRIQNLNVLVLDDLEL